MTSATQQVFLGVTAVVASPAMRQLLALVQRAARTQASILITGETGSGKEVAARAVHHYSLRAKGPWVDINCGALPEHLIESELFGHEKGAFSGADTAKPGLFELAHTGTLFLDEVGELEPRMQVKLLRVLDGLPYYRLGGQKKVSVDTRVVAATNRDLEAAVANGSFRGDLFHRLNQVPVRVPPLRERIDDIIPVAEHYLHQHSERASFSTEAKDLLCAYSWPGNIRELRNAVVAALVASDGDRIEASHFGLHPAHTAPARWPASRGLSLDELEREAILEALRRAQGHQQKSAAALGISRRTLSRKLKQYSLSPKEDGAYVA
jgi:DNA-binding NtrC family response regulator